MQRLFKMKRSGGVSIGEVVKFEGALFVITHIVKILKCDQKGNMELQIVAQQFGSKTEYAGEGHFYHYERRYENGEESEDQPFEQTGNACLVTNENCGYVCQILYIKPDQEDLLVDCALKPFEPWSEEEMKQAVKKDRLSTFTVLDGRADKGS
ncbi:hypothetical protein [Enterococcus sp. AZ109]|uniref:hypothetical protein n=1 Tax=Enterococcus sp. AZ109 TaxID=2774634 RepID=UPI003F1FC319